MWVYNYEGQKEYLYAKKSAYVARLFICEGKLISFKEAYKPQWSLRALKKLMRLKEAYKS